MRNFKVIVLSVVVSALLSGCQSMLVRSEMSPQPVSAGSVVSGKGASRPVPESALDTVSEEAGPSREADPEEAGVKRESMIISGSGRFVAGSAPAGQAEQTVGKIILNFENTDIREVVKVILGEQLNAGYVIDPAVNGGVTLQTGKPLRTEDLLPTLEMLLRMNNAALIQDEHIYRVVPLQNAISGNLTLQLGDSRTPLPNGYNVRIVPLDYIGAAEMADILKPMVSERSIVRVDGVRNLLILSGTSNELASLEETIRIFDVDWMSGLSVGLFPLEYSEVGDMIEKVKTVLGIADSNAVQGALKILPIEALNAVLVISQQEQYIRKVETWVKRFDEVASQESVAEQQFFVYRVKNGDAVKLADLLGQVFSDSGASKKKSTGASITPNQKPVLLSALGANSNNSKTNNTQPNKKPTPVVRKSNTSNGIGGVDEIEVKIVADEETNSLLITSSAKQYTKIKQVLEQLDITPLQVLIEATIIEVQLQGGLKYGLQWFFSGGHQGYSGSGSLDGTLDSTGTSGLNNIFPGFNYSLVDSLGQVRAVFSTLAENTNVRVLSSPSVMVLDNREARIQVGDQVPIATQQQQDTDSVNSTIVNSIQYKDTGIVLDVKPRVTPGGLVTMEVEQEVSDVSATQSSNLDSPTISTRKITSAVAVKNGSAIVLGGLIRDRKEQGSAGLPGLHELPMLGWLFGQKNNTDTRTELVVVLVPKIVGSSNDAEEVLDDFRARMRGLQGQF